MRLDTDYRNEELELDNETLQKELVLHWRANDTHAIQVVLTKLNKIQSSIAQRRGQRTYVLTSGLLNIVE